MTAPRVDRRLEAIRAVDLVGCSGLIGADEAGTIVRVKIRSRPSRHGRARGSRCGSLERTYSCPQHIDEVE
jgi:hypothetical protein